MGLVRAPLSLSARAQVHKGVFVPTESPVTLLESLLKTESQR